MLLRCGHASIRAVHSHRLVVARVGLLWLLGLAARVAALSSSGVATVVWAWHWVLVLLLRAMRTRTHRHRGHARMLMAGVLRQGLGMRTLVRVVHLVLTLVWVRLRSWVARVRVRLHSGVISGSASRGSGSVGRSSERLRCTLISHLGLSLLLGVVAELLLGLSGLFRKLRILALNLIVVVGDRVDVEGLWSLLVLGLLGGCPQRLARFGSTLFHSMLGLVLLGVAVHLVRCGAAS